MTASIRTRTPVSSTTEQLAPGDPLTIVKDLVNLRRLIGLYPDGHPLITERLQELDTAVQWRLREHDAIRVDVIGGDVFVDGDPTRRDSKAHASALEELTGVGIHSVHVQRGVTPDELRSAAAFLWNFDGQAGGEPVSTRLDGLGVRHVSFGRIVPLDTQWASRRWADAPGGTLDPSYEEALGMARATFRRASDGQDLDAAAVQETVQLLVHRVSRSSAALGHIMAVKQYENLTWCHSVNVAMLSLLIGRQVGLDGPTIIGLVEAALLHDIGKTRVPLDVVSKPGALDRHERRLIEAHAALGGEILASTAGLKPLTPTVALEHHRTIQGRGYPDLGDGVMPHALSQIVSVADVYEALTGARSYKEPAPPERACVILARIAGDQLNAALVKTFIGTITFFPVGSFVRTNREETAVVVRTNPSDPIRPVIAIFNHDLNSVIAEVDLADLAVTGAGDRHIVETIPAPPDAPDLTGILGPVVDDRVL